MISLGTFRKRIGFFIAPIVLLLAIVAMLLLLTSGIIGVGIDGNHRVTYVQAEGPAEHVGIRHGDQVIAINDCPLSDAYHCGQMSYQPGEMLSITYLRGETIYKYTLTAVAPSFQDFLKTYIYGLLIPIVICLLTWIVWLNHKDNIETQLFYAMGQLGAVTLILLTLTSRYAIASRAYNITFCLLAPAMIHFHAGFPKKRWLAHQRWMLVLLYGVGMLLGFIWPIRPIHNLWMSLAFAVATGFVVTAYITSQYPDDRRRIRVIVIGTIIGFGPVLLLTVLPAALFRVQWMPLKYTTFPLLAVPLAYSVAIWRYRLMEFDRAINRGLVLMGVVGIIYGIYFAGLTLFSHLLPKTLIGRATLGALIALIAAFTFPYLSKWTQHLVDRLFFGGWYDAKKIIDEMGHLFAQARNFENLYGILLYQIPQAMYLSGAGLWIKQDNHLRLMGKTSEGMSGEIAWLENHLNQREIIFADPRAIIPLIAENRTLGIWVLEKRAGDDWRPDDRHILLTLSRQAATATRNLSLISGLHSKITEAEEIHRRLLDAREEERAELAREIHDGVIQDLIGLRYRLEALQEEGDASGQYGELHNQAGVLIDELRLLCSHLRPPLLKDLGLAAALRSLAREVSLRGLPVVTRLEDVLLPEDTAIGLYRIAQEALYNSLRHADAHNATLSTVIENQDLIMEIIDDGQGFEPTAAMGDESSYGLTGMIERARAIGGVLEIESQPNAGTRVIARIKCSEYAKLITRLDL